jgi:hypothetical protein
MRSFLAVCLLCAACGSDSGDQGDPCSTSADCNDGLLCDTTRSPPTCESMLSPHPDLAGADLSGAVNDLAHED